MATNAERQCVDCGRSTSEGERCGACARAVAHVDDTTSRSGAVVGWRDPRLEQAMRRPLEPIGQRVRKRMWSSATSDPRLALILFVLAVLGLLALVLAWR